MRRRAPEHDSDDKNAADPMMKKNDSAESSNSDNDNVSDSDDDENVVESENDDNGAPSVSEEEEQEEAEDDSEDDSSVEEEPQFHVVEEEEGSDNDEAHTTAARTLKNNSNASGSTAAMSSTTLDLRNLLALSTLPLDPSVLYKSSNKSHNNKGKSNDTSPANESFLLQQAQSGCQELLHALWQLPVERRDSSITAAGPLALLPTVDASHVPRALPPPPPKQDTKWEKFAREKGIGQNKDKRSAKVWDEATGEWMYRHGYQKANNSDNKEWPIMEAVPDDPMADPWERTRQAKRARVDKNSAQQLLNQERAGMVAKGSAKRLLKAKNKSQPDQQQQQQLSGKKSNHKIYTNRREELPVGLPVDLAPAGRKGNSDIATTTATPAQRGATSTKAALRATQVSTASLGKFDALRQDEPARRAAMNQAANKKRKFQSGTDKAVLATESERSLKVWQQLNRVGGGKTAEVARKKGRLAKGETAYDYDYSDGLGAASFRKKKGRAGAGKMKKMTKKRAK